MSQKQDRVHATRLASSDPKPESRSGSSENWEFGQYDMQPGCIEASPTFAVDSVQTSDYIITETRERAWYGSVNWIRYCSYSNAVLGDREYVSRGYATAPRPHPTPCGLDALRMLYSCNCLSISLVNLKTLTVHLALDLLP